MTSNAVETSQAGPGNLEVTVNGGQVPTSAQAHGLHTYAISFTPKDPKPHEVELKFNGENVPGGKSTPEPGSWPRLLIVYQTFCREPIRLPGD